MKMNMGNYILVDRKPVEAADINEWCKFFEGKDSRRVALDKFSKDITISTVFLGIDHRFSGEGLPILFETMIFGGSLGEHYDEWQDRYCTWEEAEAGHMHAVKLIFDDALERRDWDLVEEIKTKYPKVAE